MLDRCNNKNNQRYTSYGGRGIKVCKQWFKFKNFLKDMGNCPTEFSLDRINNNKGYFKSNCRWTSNQEQSRNRRANIKFKGEIATDVSCRLGGSKNLISTRISRKWDIKKAFTTPIIKSKHQD